MAHIKKLTLANWMGLNTEIQLGKFTLIKGENGTGKSAIGNAATVALCGYHPSYGKLPSSTFDMAGNVDSGAVSTEIRAELSNGDIIEREYFQKPDGGYGQRGEKGAVIPPVMVDVNDYLKKTGPEKRTFMFSKLDLKKLGLTNDALAEKIKSGWDTEKATDDDEDTMTTALDAIYGVKSGDDKQAWLEEVEAAIKKIYDAARESAQNAEGTIKNNAENQAKKGLVAIARPNPARLSAARVELAGAQSKKEAFNDQQRQFDAANVTVDVAAIQTTLADKESAAEAKRNEIKPLKEKTESHNSIAQDAQVKAAQAAAVYQKAAEKRRAAQLAYDKEFARLETLEHSRTCKACGAVETTGTAEEIAESKQKVSKLSDELAEAAKQDGIAKTASEQAGATLTAARQSDDNNVKNVHLLNGHLSQLSKIEAEISSLKRQIEDATKDKPLPPSAEEVQKNAALIDTLKAEIVKLEAADREEAARLQDERTVANAQKDFETASREAIIYGQAMNMVAEYKKEVIAKAFGYFLEKINKFTSPLMEPLIYRDDTIGYLRGAQFVKLKTFGGTQSMLTLAGLSVALAQEAKHKVIIFDEMGIVSKETKKVLIPLFVDLIKAGVIEQVICIEPDGEAYEYLNECELGDDFYTVVDTATLAA